ncbi:MAG: CsbD family protein [Bdellovibrionota bacterium]
MEMNKHGVNGKWNEIKGEIQKAWGQLTDDEVQQTKGDMTAIRGLVQQKYGQAQTDFEDRWNAIVDRAKTKKEEVVESVKDDLRS